MSKPIDPRVLRCLEQLQRQRLERRIDDLNHIAEWRDDLRRRLWRAQATFEVVDIDHDDTDLLEEVEAFKRVCRALQEGEAR